MSIYIVVILFQLNISLNVDFMAKNTKKYTKPAIRSLSLEREEMWPLFLTNINGHIEPILEHNHYCDDNVLNLKRHSGNISFVRPLDLLRFSCNQCFKKGQ